jgi:nucleotide-binding universal stress UspA family protein
MANIAVMKGSTVASRSGASDTSDQRAPLPPPRKELGAEFTPALGRRGRIATVLLATDLSGVSDEATDQAIDLAFAVNARLLIVNVIDPAARLSSASLNRLDQQRAEREPRLLEIVERARAWGVETTHLLWTGEAGKSIVAAAEAERADLIVVGSRGLARAGRWLLGSVSDHVVHHASCPVLVVR